jgi:hypothetical protein
MTGLGHYLTKAPISEVRNDEEAPLLHQPDIVMWLYKSLQGRRLIEFGRGVREIAMAEQPPDTACLIEIQDEFQTACPDLDPGIDADETYLDKETCESMPSLIDPRVDKVPGQSKTQNRHGKKVKQLSIRDEENSGNFHHENKLIKMLPSMHFLSGQKEPIMIIRNYTTSPSTEGGWHGLEEIMKRHAEYLTFLDSRHGLNEKDSLHNSSGRPNQIGDTLEMYYSDFQFEIIVK